MTGRTKIILSGTLYFLNVLIFALIYYYYWKENTSNFIINSEFNEVTIDRAFFSGSDPLQIDTNSISFSTREANELLSPLFDSLNLLTSAVKITENHIAQNYRHDSLLTIQLSVAHGKNEEKYLQEKIRPFTRIKDSLTADILSLRRTLKVSRNRQLINEIEVNLARSVYQNSMNDVLIAMATSDVIREGLRDKVKFYDDSVYSVYDSLQEEKITLEHTRSELLGKVEKIKEQVLKIDTEYHSGRFRKVGFGDFIYFSVITSTSTGYGDILPNTSIIRGFVSTEILLSLILLGLFLNWITSKD